MEDSVIDDSKVKKVKLKFLIHPKAAKFARGEFVLEGDISHLTEDFFISELIFEIERRLNERGDIRVHAELS